MPPVPSVFLALLPLGAWGADTDPFEPAGSLAYGDGTLHGESPTLGPPGLAAALSSAAAQGLSSAESTHLALAFQGSWIHRDRLRVDLLLPVYPRVQTTDFSGAAMGDVRVQGVLPLYSSGEVLSLAAMVGAGLPTGTSDALVGRGTHLRGGLSAGGTSAGVGYVLNLGATAAPTDQVGGTEVGSTLDLLGGAWVGATDQVRVGAEGTWTAGRPGQRTSTAHLFIQTALPSGFTMTTGAGTALRSGLGAPTWRLFAGLSYAPGPRDRDADGLADTVDTCPEQAEDLDGFQDGDGCPESDNDRDGVADLEDRCPGEPEDRDGFWDNDGCPDPDDDGDGVVDGADSCPRMPGLDALSGCPDADGDGLADREDACPWAPGVEATGGCPDRDGDGVADLGDLCPDIPLHPQESATDSDGCPGRVVVWDGRIEITEKVLFELGSSTIDASSHDLLDEVARVIQAKADIDRVEIAGHTDSVGSAAANQRLSEDRARAVVDYLAARGVRPAVLVARGYGAATPIDSNETEAGRARNRRVEFSVHQAGRAVVEVEAGPSPWDLPPDAEPPPEPDPWATPEPPPDEPPPAAPDPEPIPLPWDTEPEPEPTPAAPDPEPIPLPWDTEPQPAAPDEPVIYPWDAPVAEWDTPPPSGTSEASGRKPFDEFEGTVRPDEPLPLPWDEPVAEPTPAAPTPASPTPAAPELALPETPPEDEPLPWGAIAEVEPPSAAPEPEPAAPDVSPWDAPVAELPPEPVVYPWDEPAVEEPPATPEEEPAPWGAVVDAEPPPAAPEDPPPWGAIADAEIEPTPDEPPPDEPLPWGAIADVEIEPPPDAPLPWGAIADAEIEPPPDEPPPDEPLPWGAIADAEIEPTPDEPPPAAPEPTPAAVSPWDAPASELPPEPIVYPWDLPPAEPPPVAPEPEPPATPDIDPWDAPAVADVTLEDPPSPWDAPAVADVAPEDLPSPWDAPGTDTEYEEPEPLAEPDDALPWGAIDEGTPVGLPEDGTLTVVLHEGLYANVYVDDRKLAVTAPFRKVDLTGGQHTIQVVNHQARINDVRKVYVDGHDVVIELGEEGEAGPASTSPWDLRPEAEDAAPWGGTAEPPPDEVGSPADDVPPELRAAERDDLWEVPWLTEEPDEATDDEEGPSRRERRRREREAASEEPPPPPPLIPEDEEEEPAPWGEL